MYSKLLNSDSSEVVNVSTNDAPAENSSLFYSDRASEVVQKRLIKINILLGALNLIILLSIIIFLSIEVGTQIENINEIDFHKVKALIDSIELTKVGTYINDAERLMDWSCETLPINCSAIRQPKCRTNLN